MYLADIPQESFLNTVERLSLKCEAVNTYREAMILAAMADGSIRVKPLTERYDIDADIYVDLPAADWTYEFVFGEPGEPGYGCSLDAYESEDAAWFAAAVSLGLAPLWAEVQQ